MASELSIPFDIADVEILMTEITSAGKLLLQVESRQTTTICGCCGKEIRCNHGHGAPIKLRHLPVLGMETYLLLRPKRAQCQDCRT